MAFGTYHEASVIKRRTWAKFFIVPYMHIFITILEESGPGQQRPYLTARACEITNILCRIS
jgi:hypothetical protein